MPADFARAREQDPYKQAEKVTPKAMPALPRMGENGQAPIKKGIENTVEHGSYQCLMTPTGPHEPVNFTGFKPDISIRGNAGGNTRDTMMAFDSLAELIALWPSLTETDRADLLCIAKSMATDTTGLHAAADRRSSRLTEHFSSRKP